ncbi:hypothetical protein SAMN05877809_101516 [Rhodobacter sp. JA431]|nr:hypothetical protein SAMN05877809_101516 [Rhodobacter sp. JA431]
MQGQAQSLCRRLRVYVARSLRAVVIFGLVGVIASPAQSQDILWTASSSTLVVRSDWGGYLAKRRREIDTLRASGTRVELRGTCISACTMYLSLPNVCVAPTAVFGFHGPSRSGTPLPREKFDYWSEIMASGYREPLLSWYMSTGRHTIVGYYEVTGTRLIEMGYPPC